MNQGIKGFMDFIREQGVVGLAIGFILGGAVSKLVSALVENIINPLIGLLMGRVNLADKMIVVGDASIMWGAFVSTLIDFIIIAAVVYWGFKALKIESLDKKKDA
ncbi:MscL family protein [Candidatus Nomurabacteria bacterium]|nr:MscL family protein [Candidatus Nomurabacteria bacterium]USN94714.1 MAG: MscL family protein [Candidatus Nomurabacteria bacterium]